MNLLCDLVDYFFGRHIHAAMSVSGVVVVVVVPFSSGEEMDLNRYVSQLFLLLLTSTLVFSFHS